VRRRLAVAALARASAAIAETSVGRKVVAMSFPNSGALEEMMEAMHDMMENAFTELDGLR